MSIIDAANIPSVGEEGHLGRAQRHCRAVALSESRGGWSGAKISVVAGPKNTETYKNSEKCKKALHPKHSKCSTKQTQASTLVACLTSHEKEMTY